MLAASDAGDNLPELRLDAVDDILFSPRREQALRTDYHKAVYMQALERDSQIREVTEREEMAPFARTLLYYQSTNSAARLVEESELEPLYRSVAKEVRQLLDLTTVQLVEGGKGELD